MSFFISGSWTCFCSVIHWSDSRIRALSVLLYSSTITSGAQSRAAKKSLERLFFSLSLTRSLEELVSRCQKSLEEFIISLWIDFALLHESHRKTWRSIVVVIFSSSRFELIDLSAEIVAKRQIDDCFWIFSLSDLFHWVVCACWDFDDTMIKVFCVLLHCRNHVDEDSLRCSERRFSRERSSRVELLQNRCFQKFSRVRFVDVWKIDCLLTIVSSWNTCKIVALYSFKKSRVSNTFLDADYSCIATRFAAFASSSTSRRRRVFSAFASAHSERKQRERSVLWSVNCMIFVRIHYNV